MNKNNTNRIHFMKMHGVGNDYIFVDTAQCAIPDPQTASIAWSRPHMGIGSDGLVLIGRAETPEADHHIAFHGFSPSCISRSADRYWHI